MTVFISCQPLKYLNADQHMYTHCMEVGTGAYMYTHCMEVGTGAYIIPIPENDSRMCSEVCQHYLEIIMSQVTGVIN